jgi:hypothetical protein
MPKAAPVFHVTQIPNSRRAGQAVIVTESVSLAGSSDGNPIAAQLDDPQAHEGRVRSGYAP